MPAERSRSLPVRPAASKVPHELRELERYLFLAVLLAAATLGLVAAEKVEPSRYLFAMRFAMTFAVTVVCATAISRSRSARRGLVRSAPSAHDAVTGLPDEQYFWLRLREEHARTRRYGEPFAVAVLDVHSLAAVNRSYGETAVDALLAYVARTLDSAKRGSDVAVRLSDDEFALLLLDCDRNGASALANRLQQYLSGEPAHINCAGRTLSIPLGASIGFAVVTNHETSSEELVARARQRLAAAKEEKALQQERWAI